MSIEQNDLPYKAPLYKKRLKKQKHKHERQQLRQQMSKDGYIFDTYGKYKGWAW